MMKLESNQVFFKHYEFSDFPELDEYWKEQIGLSVISFYLTQNDEFFMTHYKKCECCYGKNPKSIFWILDKSGKVIRQENEDFYLQNVKNIKSILKFNIPERLRKNYLKF